MSPIDAELPLVDRLRTRSRAVFLAAESGSADDLSSHLVQAADEIERLRRRVAVLETVIQEELDEFDCCDEANRMIVENIHERGASVSLPSDQRQTGE